MSVKKLNSSDNHLKIGDVFTPLKWAEFAIQKFNIFDQWLAGASVFDPTMGSGNLLEALITYGIKLGYSLRELPTNQLYGNEMNTDYYNQALNKFLEEYGLNMNHNLLNYDVLNITSQKQKQKFNIIFGNPPWQNFVDLPESYKEQIKPEFFKYDLVNNKKNLLLGGSRIDIAALIIQKSIKDFLAQEGNAYFFMPLSLLLNDGANQNFRRYKIHDTKYALAQVFDFNDSGAFSGVSTRYGLAHFRRDQTAIFPISYERYENEDWRHFLAKPLLNPTDPLSVFKAGTSAPLDNFKPIIAKKESTPRQGINTCGANSVFFFKSYRELDDITCVVNEDIQLPRQYVYPLLTSQNFKESYIKPNKWVLLPYSPNGRPLEPSHLREIPKLWNYLKLHEKHLKARKGILIGNWLKKGYWWALLGVGVYNFTAYKIVWEAYGKKKFYPIMVQGNWQANQSLQAFVPTQTLEAAEKLLRELKNPVIEDYLLSLKMEGTMNWAQPGKIKKLMQLVQ